MATLTHFRFCARSRAIRLALAELGREATLIETRPWEWPQDLLDLNPAGEVPVLQLDAADISPDHTSPITLCGHYAISEYLAETNAGRLLPATSIVQGASTRAETRRLVDWCHGKLQREVTEPLLEQLVLPLFKGTSQASPHTEILRAARANLAYHLRYVGWLADQRSWLAGPELSFADLAAGAHLSCLDYLGEIDWAREPGAKAWYQRLKSRKSFRPLLADRVPGRPPALHYAELDF